MKAQPELLKRVNTLRKYAKTQGVPTRVTSTVRTRAAQQKLWDNRNLNPYPVSPPGSSTHEYGLAADIIVDPRVFGVPGTDHALEAQHWLSELAPHFGLYSLKSDPIHFQLVAPATWASWLKGNSGRAQVSTGSSFAIVGQSPRSSSFGFQPSFYSGVGGIAFPRIQRI